MSGHLRVIAPGLMTTVQDLGRPGYQRLGVPPSGALDPVALRAANLLAGNPATTAVLAMVRASPVPRRIRFRVMIKIPPSDRFPLEILAIFREGFTCQNCQNCPAQEGCFVRQPAFKFQNGIS